MSKEFLQMKYHPAKKEVEFRRYLNGKEVAIRDGSRLKSYMNKKGQFVLQDYGNKFFEDIANAFDGLTSLDVQVITTKMDYEDFEQMVEYYNKTPNTCKINTTLLAELPDMKETYKEVVNYGNKAIEILQDHRGKLFEITRIEKDIIKKSAESFAAQIDEEAHNIQEKINCLSDTNVSLCFAGVYSAGKSALINALLGYRILPENINSETAKIFKIYSPKKGETEKIIFDIDNVRTVLEWNKTKKFYEFTQGPSESECKTEIQLILNSCIEDKKMQHEQIAAILTKLNDLPEIAHDVEIVFPIAIDSEEVQFTIFDTPGTDSNYQEHQTVLKDALSEQKQSILVFVAAPNKLEGTGNEALFNFLKQAEELDSKTSVDIGRSLFVINWADTTDIDQRSDLQTSSIKYQDMYDEEKFTIKLEDKKLFFTSAKYGNAAHSKINGVASKRDVSLVDRGYSLLQDEFEGFCYRQNRCATSELATNNIIEQSEKELRKAIEEGNKEKAVMVCSGLFALETEIKNYGEKYASAVKAFAIIDSVNRALTKLTNRANSLRESNLEDINTIENSITNLRDTINLAIEEAYNNTTLSKSKVLPEDTIKRLKIDSETISKTILGNMEIFMNKALKGWFLGLLGKVKIKDKDKKKVKRQADEIIKDFSLNFLAEREKLLTEQRDAFMERVRNAIVNNGEISDSAKKYMQDVPKPKIEKPDEVIMVNDIYDSNKRTHKVLWLDRDYLDKEGFVKDVKEHMQGIIEKMTDDYKDDYRASLETLLMQIKSNFQSNLSSYSIHMRAMIEDKDAMVELGSKIESAAISLNDCEEQLNEIIWKEIQNG
ncbi:MAG: dynamin family protein [Clostridia bacterium]|nr:dynamin family protein [Clostridia bacterium]